MILNLLNLYTLIFALFGKVNAMTTRLAVMKTNISLQGLNLADLLDQHSSTSTTMMMTPIFNATSESSAYYNVTDPILFILNATETNPNNYMDIYSSTVPSTSIEPVTEDDDSWAGTCFHIMVDCSTLIGIDPSTIPTTTTILPVEEEEDEIIYDEEEDYETIPERLKRQVLSLLDQTTTANPLLTSSRTTPQSIGRLLDSLNTILRNLKRNSTVRVPFTTLPFSPSTTAESVTTERKPLISEETTSTPEFLDDLIRWHTAGLIFTTEEEEEENEEETIDVSNSVFDVLNATQHPADVVNMTEDYNETTITELPEETTTTTTTKLSMRSMCPLVVCPWNDTVGYFNSLTTTHLPDETNSSTLPCRGDNPQGCTPFWTSSRDESITSFHSSVYFSSSTTQSSNDGNVFFLI